MTLISVVLAWLGLAISVPAMTYAVYSNIQTRWKMKHDPGIALQVTLAALRGRQVYVRFPWPQFLVFAIGAILATIRLVTYYS